MTMSQIDNFLKKSNNCMNITNLNIAEHIGNLTDADLRKQLMRYDMEEASTIQNDLSYSNIS